MRLRPASRQRASRSAGRPASQPTSQPAGGRCRPGASASNPPLSWPERRVQLAAGQQVAPARPPARKLARRLANQTQALNWARIWLALLAPAPRARPQSADHLRRPAAYLGGKSGLCSHGRYGIAQRFPLPGAALANSDGSAAAAASSARVDVVRVRLSCCVTVHCGRQLAANWWPLNLPHKRAAGPLRLGGGRAAGRAHRGGGGAALLRRRQHIAAPRWIQFVSASLRAGAASFAGGRRLVPRWAALKLEESIFAQWKRAAAEFR